MAIARPLSPDPTSTTFTLRGTRGGQPLALTWSDGVLSGEGDDAQHVIARVHETAQAFDGVLYGPPSGPYTMHKHLDSPYTALYMLRRQFDPHPPPTMEGSVPAQADPPKGAVR